jgi:nicotinamidase-related amidase
MAVWDDLLSEEDRAVYELSGWGVRQGWGARPALLVVDVNYDFVGFPRAPIVESVRMWRNSCGEYGWQAVGQIARLLAGARDAGIPIVFTTAAHDQGGDTRRGKCSRSGERLTVPGLGRAGNDIVDEIAPRAGEFVIRKHHASAFFGTTLPAYLIGKRVDSVIIAGTTTSGCVRATVVDAASYNFKVALVEDCVFDRWQISHKVALFDLNAKYADVVRLDETLDYLRWVGPSQRAAAR